jgi:methyl-accepting chemotaxis protein
MVGTMSDISSSSKKIAEIIGVIDSIAFQTNMLALNAAVEAARAGEHGRGFAVVAAEVGTLAQRSAQSAREIKALIGSSVDRMEQGVKLAHSAGDAMQEVTEAVKRVDAVIRNIEVNARTQADGIRQINQAIGQLDAAAKHNTELVAKSAAASRSLEQQTVGLSNSVSCFELADGAQPRAVAARQPQRADDSSENWLREAS